MFCIIASLHRCTWNLQTQIYYLHHECTLSVPKIEHKETIRFPTTAFCSLNGHIIMVRRIQLLIGKFFLKYFYRWHKFKESVVFLNICFRKMGLQANHSSHSNATFFKFKTRNAFCLLSVKCPIFLFNANFNALFNIHLDPIYWASFNA